MERRSPVSTVKVATVVGLLAFAFRVTNVRGLSNDHYMHLAWAQQLLFGELPGRDFVDPGMPLAYVLSALVQLMSPGPSGEAVLCCVMLALAAAVTHIVVADLTGSSVAGVAAAAIEVALVPRLYSYPKILVPAVAVLLIQRYTRRRDRQSLVLMGAWTAVAVLLRHDLGVYAAAGAGAALLWMHWSDPRRTAARAIGVYAVSVTCALIPYVAFIAWAEGLPEHFHEALEFARGEAHQRFLAPPSFPFLDAPGGISAWSTTDSATLLFYASYVAAAVALVLLLTARRERGHATGDTSTGPVMAAVLAMFALYLAVVLRHPIVSRVPDIAALLAMIGVWDVVETARRADRARVAGSPVAKIVGGGALALVLGIAAVSTASVWNLGELTTRFRETRVADGVEVVSHALGAGHDGDAQWPWEGFWPAGELPDAVRYLNACTTPDEAVLVTWAAPEYYFFAKRRFASGHALFLPPDAFTTAHDQQRMLARLEHQRVPIVLINETRGQEFATAYGDVDRYLRERYVPAGHFSIRDGSDVTIAVRRGLTAERSYGADGWPCFDSRAASSTASIMLEGSAMSFPAMSNAVP